MKLIQSVPILAALAFLSACGEKELILEGEREDIRASLSDTAAGAPLDAVGARPLALPPVQSNAAWTHRGGTASHRLTHPALGAVTQRMFSAPIGQGNGRKHRIGADPVVAGGRIFTLDSRALVTATGTNGQTLWQTDLTLAPDRSDDASGGGVAVADGRVFATTGFGELVALDAANGQIVWRQEFDASVGGAPTVAGGLVYVVARDSSAWAVRASDGRVQWQLPGTPSPSGVTGVSAPAVNDRLVVFPFPSGELVAALREGGARVWGTQVSGRRLGRAYASVLDLTGDPVISNNVIYTGSAAGRLVATDGATGDRIWTAREGAVGPVVLGGGSLFLVSDENRLMRLDATTGETVWGIDLPLFVKERPKRQQAIYAHYGPLLAGGRLYVASSDGMLRSFDPTSGQALAELEIPGGAASAPVVAGGVLYVVSANGQLHAFR